MSIKTLRAVLPFVGWAAAVVVGADPETKEEKLAIFQDIAFRRGFLLNFPSSTRGREVEKVLDGVDPAGRPVWRLCQWATRHSLAGAARVRLPNGDESWEKDRKSTRLNSSHLKLSRMPSSA